jgi:hypothetical protein
LAASSASLKSFLPTKNSSSRLTPYASDARLTLSGTR